MSRRILLIEPYPGLAETFGMFLEEMDCDFDIVPTCGAGESCLTQRPYGLATINIDQNDSDWHDKGLLIAERAKELGIPVVMIADHQLDATTISENGWLAIRKPFTLERFKSVIEHVGAC
jgi:hypothetical protein